MKVCLCSVPIIVSRFYNIFTISFSPTDTIGTVSSSLVTFQCSPLSSICSLKSFWKIKLTDPLSLVPVDTEINLSLTWESAEPSRQTRLSVKLAHPVADTMVLAGHWIPICQSAQEASAIMQWYLLLFSQLTALSRITRVLLPEVSCAHSLQATVSIPGPGARAAGEAAGPRLPPLPPRPGSDHQWSQSLGTRGRGREREGLRGWRELVPEPALKCHNLAISYIPHSFLLKSFVTIYITWSKILSVLVCHWEDFSGWVTFSKQTGPEATQVGITQYRRRLNKRFYLPFTESTTK